MVWCFPSYFFLFYFAGDFLRGAGGLLWGPTSIETSSSCYTCPISDDILTLRDRMEYLSYNTLEWLRLKVFLNF
jgi:hypothetical protein